MIIPISDSMLALANKRNVNLHQQVQNNFVFEIVSYLIDSKKRRAVELSDWIKEQVDNPSANLLNLAESIPYGKNHDETVIKVLRWENVNFQWTKEQIRWKTTEYWATAEEIIQEWIDKLSKFIKDDCEAYAVLGYIICRLKGVPANRLLIWTGNVQKAKTAPLGGHCALFYSPINYPFNFVNLDGCYYPDMNEVPLRSFYTFNEQNIIPETETWTPYERTWFLFNESYSTTSYKLRSL